MPRGYWRPVLALVGWLILSAQHPGLPANSKESERNQAVADALTNIARTYHEQAKRTEGSPESRPCKAGDDQRDSDLCAQWKAADAATEAAWWASMSSLFSGFGLLGVAVAIGLTIQSNRIARDTAKRQLRAYVSLKTLEPPKLALGKKVAVSVVIENTGQTPAQIMKWESFLTFREDNFLEDDLKPVPLENKPSTLVLGKGHSATVNITSNSPLNEEGRVRILSGKTLVFVYGFVVYKNVFGGTGFMNFRVRLTENAQCWVHCTGGNEAN